MEKKRLKPRVTGCVLTSRRLNYGTSLADCKNVHKNAVPSKVLEQGEREIRHHGAIRGRLYQFHKFLRIPDRQGPEQHDVHQTE